MESAASLLLPVCPFNTVHVWVFDKVLLSGWCGMPEYGDSPLSLWAVILRSGHSWLRTHWSEANCLNSLFICLHKVGCDFHWDFDKLSDSTERWAWLYYSVTYYFLLLKCVLITICNNLSDSGILCPILLVTSMDARLCQHSNGQTIRKITNKRKPSANATIKKQWLINNINVCFFYFQLPRAQRQVNFRGQVKMSHIDMNHNSQCPNLTVHTNCISTSTGHTSLRTENSCGLQMLHIVCIKLIISSWLCNMLSSVSVDFGHDLCGFFAQLFFVTWNDSEAYGGNKR